MKSKIPTTIFSGFLGSGKTTVISHLVEELQNRGEQIVYIKNEIGDSDVDTKVLQGKGIKTKELLNGCICCTLVGPFINSINEIVETFNPDRILIEASGAADPSALALMVSSHPSLERDGVIAIVDVVNFTGYKDLSTTTQNQTKFTDLIIFNKIELADIKQKQAVVGYVRELNTHSPIVEAPNGKLNPEIVFGINHKELNDLLKTIKSEHTHSDHIKTDKIESFTIKTNKKIEKGSLEQFLETIPKNIFRAKGIITLPNNQRLIFNTVGNRTTFLETDTTQSENIFIFIGYGANECELKASNQLKKLFKE
jgi:G3E family GTPase